jgi:hypothetical protein
VHKRFDVSKEASGTFTKEEFYFYIEPNAHSGEKLLTNFSKGLSKQSVCCLLAAILG